MKLCGRTYFESGSKALICRDLAGHAGKHHEAAWTAWTAAVEEDSHLCVEPSFRDEWAKCTCSVGHDHTTEECEDESGHAA